MATEIIRQCSRRKSNNTTEMNLLNYSATGKDWVRQFLNQHPDLRLKRARCIDATRVTEVSPEKVMEWFKTVKQVIRDYKIETKNIYNMNETGFSIGSTQAGYVIVD